MDIKQFIKDSVLVTLLGFVSRLFALLRDAVLLVFLGTGSLSDAFNLAVKLPNSFRHAVAEGAINNVLLPKLHQLEKNQEHNRIYALIFNIAAIFIAILLFFYFIQQLFFSYFLFWIVPGFNQHQSLLYSQFIPITSFSSVVYLIYSLLGALLQFRGYFFWPSFSLILFNFSFIFFIYFASLLSCSIKYIVYLYFASTIILMSSTLFPCLFYQIFDEHFLSKFYVSLFLFIFLFSFVFLQIREQFISFVLFYLLYLYFASKMHFFSYLSFLDLQSFFYLFFPIFFIGILGQLNDIVSMGFGSLFPPGSMTIVIRSGKIIQFPIAFIMPLFITLFSYLNKFSHDQSSQLFLKRFSLLFVFFVTFAFALFCYFFTAFFIQFAFFFKISSDDLLLMIPIVRLYSFAVPAILMTRLFQIFFFIDQRVWLPFFISLLNVLFYTFFINLFISFHFSLTSIVWPFVLCSWITFFIYFSLGKLNKLF